MTMRQRLSAEQAFTLTEMVIVLVIISILLVVTMVSYLGYRDKANNATARANVHVILPSIEMYHADTGSYVGMTLSGLKTSYDQSIDPSMYTLTSLTDSDYCVASSVGGKSWKKTGPGTDIVPGVCT
jgi:general secretion pathway protein G